MNARTVTIIVFAVLVAALIGVGVTTLVGGTAAPTLGGVVAGALAGGIVVMVVRARRGRGDRGAPPR